MDSDMTSRPVARGLFERLRAWPSRSFANRIASTALAVTVLLLVVVGVASHIGTRTLILENVHQRLQTQTDLSGQHLELHLNGLARAMDALATNTLMGTALTDSRGREGYLQPFLRDFRLPLDVPFLLVLCDFQGVVIAANQPQPSDGYRHLPWLATVIDQGRPHVELGHDDAARPHLLVALPVLYPATGLPEGMLVLGLPLGEVYRQATSFLPPGTHHWLSHGGHPHFLDPALKADDFLIVTRRPLHLEGTFQDLNLAMMQGELPATVLTPLHRMTLGFVAAGALLLVIAVGVAMKIARVLTRPVAALSRTAREIAQGGDLSLRTVASGDDEIAQMARSFNQMIERLETSHNQLEARVAERTRELAQARDAAESANRAKSTFLAAMSHEIRTPMNTILGIGELLRDAERMGPRERDYLAVSLQAGETLMALINDILDLSKIEAGQLQLEDVAFDPDAEAQNAVALFQEQARRKGLRLSCTLAKGIPSWVRGDPQRLRQILLNLIGNAIKFTDHGEITLTVTHAAPDFLGFAVADTGIGIPGEKLGTIFHPFAQAESSTSRRFGGTGLGLTICRELVERMGGAIRVESSPGAGSVFRFELPLPSAEPPAAVTGQEEKPHLPGMGQEGARVLLVDDMAENRMVVSAFLEGTPHRLRQAASGEEALALFAAEPFDLVLMDIQMPGMDGYETTRALRALEAERRLPRTRVAALTAHAMKEDVERTRDVGCDLHLTKPLRRKNLLRLLQELTLPAPETSRTAAAETAPVATGPSHAAVNPATLDELRQDAGAGFSRILVRFLDHLPERLVFIDDCWRLGDRAAVKLTAHKLKGTAATFGAEGLVALCAEVEAGMDRPNGDAEGAVARLVAEGARVQAELREVFEGTRWERPVGTGKGC